MKIGLEKTKYHSYCFEFQYDTEIINFCRAIKETYGWQFFNFNEGKWRFSDIVVAVAIKNQYPLVEVDPNILIEMEEYKKEKEDSIVREKKAQEIKTKVNTKFKVKNFKGEPYEYQKIGIEFLNNNNGVGYVGDSPGVGKTLQALGYAAHNEIKKTLIICPASLKYNWQNEVKKWTNMSSWVFDSSEFKLEDVERISKIIDNHDFTIVNYDILWNYYPLFMSVDFDLVICDEAHLVKTATSQRSKATKGICKRIPKKILLSGTPVLARPKELFNALQILDPKQWKNYYDFSKKYCGGKAGFFGWEDDGATNIEELKTRIAKYFIRRTKEEVLKELPLKQYTDIPVELPSKFAKLYSHASEDLESYLRDVKDKDEDTIERSMSAQAMVKMNELRQICANGKIDSAIDIIKNTIESGEKILVFSSFIEPLKKINEKFSEESVLLTGEISAVKRQEIVDKFQSDPNTKVFLGGLKSAGVGITLTAASNVLFLDFSWTPADLEQAADRSCRIGQTAQSVNVYQLFAKDTIDEYMLEIINKKKEVFKALFGKEENASEGNNDNIMKEVIKKMKLST